MTPTQGFAYGLVQGLTEFLPVSSSAHLVLLPWLCGWEDPGLGFDVALHAGTLAAVLAYFVAQWWSLARAALAGVRAGDPLGSREAGLFWKVAAASVPAALAGALLEHAAETLFRAPLLIAGTLASFGLLLGASDRAIGQGRAFEGISWRDALIIGAAQVLAIVPGVSRSGVTITAARFLGLGREAAARFSFLLATPIVFGATVLKMRALAGVFADPGQLVALIAATLVGFAAIAGLLRFVRTRSYLPFVVYRLVLAALIVAVALRG